MPRRMTARFIRFWKSGDPFVWLTAAGVAFSLLMIGGLLLLIMIRGLGQFWPAGIDEVRLRDGRTLIGQPVNREIIPHSATAERPGGRERIRFRIGNQDIFGQDFKWVETQDIQAQSTPPDLVVLQRREWGPLYGRLTGIYQGGRAIAEGPAAWPALPPLVVQSDQLHADIHRIEQDQIGEINHRLESLRLEHQALLLDQRLTDIEKEQDREIQAQIAALERDYGRAAGALETLYAKAEEYQAGVVLSTGQEVRLPLSKIIAVHRPNAMGWTGKARIYLANLWEFLSDEPREANTEGGIFPTIFGTVMMVLIMTIAVMPFGVMAALYLREYAGQGLLVRLVRIAVNNLAGVPSIVFGVFGLGFLVYTVGGAIDALLYPEALPNPTYGTGGILWASLTLALLTVPVVIVATEEGLSAVPREFREGSIALGATKLETIWHVVLPGALPGILTGLILAMARAAGEVAPLMLTGVVKLAPELPLDGRFPFLHLDRKFMHLGFHIYDVGFQSPNVEAAKPMVYMTTLTLIVVVVLLNLAAGTLRNYLRRRYTTSAV